MCLVEELSSCGGGDGVFWASPPWVGITPKEAPPSGGEGRFLDPIWGYLGRLAPRSTVSPPPPFFFLTSLRSHRRAVNPVRGIQGLLEGCLADQIPFLFIASFTSLLPLLKQWRPSSTIRRTPSLCVPPFVFFGFLHPKLPPQTPIW